MVTVTKKQLCDRLADSLHERRSLIRNLVQTFLDEVVRELEKGNRLEFRDFGVFEVRLRRARMAQNPRTLERVPVPLKCTVKFKAGRLMKKRVQKALVPARSSKADRPVQTPSSSQPSPPAL